MRAASLCWFTGACAVFLFLHLSKRFLGAGVELGHVRTQLATVLGIAKPFYLSLI